MTDKQPASPERHNNAPARKMQGNAQPTHKAQKQVQMNHAAGNTPAVQRGRNNPAPHANQQRPVPQRPQQNAPRDPRIRQGQRQAPPHPNRNRQVRPHPSAETRQVVVKRAENRPVVTKPVVKRPAETRAVAARPAEKSPVQHSPAQKAPEVKKPASSKQKIPIRPFILFGLFLAIVGVLVFFTFFMIDESSLIKKKVTVEVGTSASFDMFLEGEPKYPQYLSTNLDFSSVDYNAPQSVFFVITLYGIDHNCELVVADTTPPEGEAVTQELFSVGPVPEASKCVTNIKDMTPVTVTWAEVPDISTGGDFTASAKLTDAAGNETIVPVPLKVTRDSVAPVIQGTRDITIILGESISYRTGITVSDNYDKEPKLDIDTSGVQLSKAGDYQAVYKATDFTGNKTEVTINVKIKPKPKNYVEPEVVYKQAKEILDTIITPGMTDMEKALQIVWWCRYNIRFNLRIKPKSWTEGAYNAFKERRGNCLSTASCVKAMLDVCGIENMFVTRWPYRVAKHYWNYVKIDGQWYHCDATWRQNYESYFFMYTTKELLAFWHDGWNGFEFDQKKYPDSATGSVQKKIDYKNHKIKT